ncbi:DUF1254 domain-containing protein [Paenarthrobacter sp. CAP02]|uniref:DUF1254 domain-containing protein n=1 Tax=Paenarthrobacter sp. CAP02 TaxID=3158144 RepID=UPI0032DA34EC
MNRLILKYGATMTILILGIFAWVIYRRITTEGWGSITLMVAEALAIWVIGTFVLIYFWPRITVSGFKRIIVRRGLGGGPIPVNTLYAVPERASESALAGSVNATGTDELLYFGGWLDVSAGPQVLHVPEMRQHYYSVQFTDAASGSNFAYVGKRTTGTATGDFLLCAAKWPGDTPPGMTRIDLPHNSALLIGRVFAANDEDRNTAYELAKQIRLTPANRP